VLESNGSTSMGSTCASSMALMDAGVPVKCMIGGVAMGLIHEDDGDIVLTDIQGIEDFLGDMDFKVTGNEEGITALQMDMKIKGISNPTLRRALAQAKEGRLHIMNCMREAISAPRPEISPNAPRLMSMTIPQEDIGTVIGPGGKTIRGIIDATGAEIDIQDDGKVTITSNDKEGAELAKKMIQNLTFKPEAGMICKGKVVRIIPIGAFVELGGGKDGMVHISQICQERIETIEPHVNIGDEVIVKVIKIDDKGRINLTIKGVTEEDKAKVQG
jgi:polyribonucleotide nucleotidyltransferase